MNTNKPLSEWTLDETKRYCAGMACVDCIFNFGECPFYDTEPSKWVIPDANARPTSGLLPVQLDERAYMPVREHSTDGGLDLKSPVDCYIQPGDSVAIDTGVHVQLPPNTTGEVVCKSGLNVNHGLICSGLIDEGYSGSIVVKLYNLSKEPYYIKAGDKIAQLVIRPVLYLTPVQVDKIEGGERGNNGFGSTGR